MSKKIFTILLVVVALVGVVCWHPLCAQSVFDLREINGDLRIRGAYHNDRTRGVLYIDFNLDGEKDLVVASTGNSTVKVYFSYDYQGTNVIYDLREEKEDVLLKGDFTGLEGIEIGYSLVTGDINGDGNLDVITSDSYFGDVYIFYASSDWESGDLLDVSEEPADLRIAYDLNTHQIWFALDMEVLDFNNDGLDDLAIDYILANNPNVSTSTGAVFIVFGRDNYPPNHLMEIEPGAADITIYGEDSNDRFGSSVASGDVNGDGVTDIIIGAYNATWPTRKGRVYCIYGEENIVTPEVVNLYSESADLMIIGPSVNSYLGQAVSCGDVNSDGYDDIFAGSIGTPPDNPLIGSAHLVHGSDLFSPHYTIDLENSLADITFYGEVSNYALGISLSINDINNDGFEDIIIGGSMGPETEFNAGVVYAYSASTLVEGSREIFVADIPPAMKVIGRYENDTLRVLDREIDIDQDGNYDLVMKSETGRDDDPPGAYCGEVNIIIENHQLRSNPAIYVGPGPSAESDVTGVGYDPYYLDILYTTQPYMLSGYGMNVACGDLDGDFISDLITGPGPGSTHPPYVMAFKNSGELLDGFLAYGVGGYGVNVTAGDLDGDGREELVTGAGPGEVYGPHVRGWSYTGDHIVPLGNVSFLAYGTNRWGVMVSCGDIDGDGNDEIITGAGPGAVFGPHVRGWDVDGGAARPIPGVSFFAYGTLRWGVNVACGDIDGDGIDEIVTGPGPSELFSSHVRGWNYDGEGIESISAVNFFAYSGVTPSMGCIVACGDADNDRVAEIFTAPGPYPDNQAYIKTWNFDGDELTLVPGKSFIAFEEEGFKAGARLAFGSF